MVKTVSKPQITAKPYPHILMSSQKKMHGWWPGRRECTAERLLINPYNGCSFNCLFCYANALDWGHFKRFRREKVVTVCRDFDQQVARTLDKMSLASCGYLSPVCDPFQPLNQKYRLSEKIIKVFTERNLPIEVITKGAIPQEALKLLAGQPKSFAQVSLLTPHERLRRKLVRGRGAATTRELFRNLERAKELGLYTVLRIDPIIPFVTDGRDDLTEILERAVSAGVSHIIASVLDLPLNIFQESLIHLYRLNPNPPVVYEELFKETIGYSRQAKLGYREEIFTFLKKACRERGLSFALCMEFKKADKFINVPTANGKIKKVGEIGLNQKYMGGCLNCEGQDIPFYVKDAAGFKFKPLYDCAGNCLNCRDAKCGLPLLAMGKTPASRKDFVLRDYRDHFKD